MKHMHIIVLILCLLWLTIPLTASAKDERIILGLSISDFETERWSMELALMTKLAKKKGGRIISQVANHDAALQNQQLENMARLGANVIIIIAEDGRLAASQVSSLARRGIPCIAYDRLIYSSALAAYISFDSIEVGRTQARAILKRVDKGRFVLLGGSPTDNNAALLRKGQMEILQPFIDKAQIEIVADRWVENWSPAKATMIMEEILTAEDNDIDAVIASNDGTALGALQAMKDHNLIGKIPISGQDATAEGCRAIVNNELTVTVLKDIRLLAPIAVDLAFNLATGQELTGLQERPLKELTMDDTMSGSVPCKFLDVLEIDRANIYNEIIVTEFHNYEDVYLDTPEQLRPPKL